MWVASRYLPCHALTAWFVAGGRHVLPSPGRFFDDMWQLQDSCWLKRCLCSQSRRLNHRNKPALVTLHKSYTVSKSVCWSPEYEMVWKSSLHSAFSIQHAGRHSALKRHRPDVQAGLQKLYSLHQDSKITSHSAKTHRCTATGDLHLFIYSELPWFQSICIMHVCDLKGCGWGTAFF